MEQKPLLGWKLQSPALVETTETRELTWHSVYKYCTSAPVAYQSVMRGLHLTSQPASFPSKNKSLNSCWQFVQRVSRAVHGGTLERR